MPRSKKEYDLNRFRKVYPLIRRKPQILKAGSQVETGKLEYATNEYTKTFTFEEPYETVPICVATPEKENLNVYITAITLTSVTVELSASNPQPDSIFVHLHIHEASTDV